MAESIADSIFSRYGSNLFSKNLKENLHSPLKDHLQIPILIDTLSRKEKHHILLTHAYSEKINQAFMENIGLHFITDHTPKNFKEAFFIYFRIRDFLCGPESLEEIQNNFIALHEESKLTHKKIIFVINLYTDNFFEENHSKLYWLAKNCMRYFANENWRFIFLSESSAKISQQLSAYFEIFKFAELNETEKFSVLKLCRTQLEKYHHVLIPDESLGYAYSITSQYITPQTNMDATFHLLDSACARCAAHDTSEQSNHPNPILTTMMISQVISQLTEISVSHLHHNKFKSSKFSQLLQQTIFGQEIAINKISSTLQRACLKLTKTTGPLCQLLFIGAPGVGKQTTAIALVENLFGSRKPFFKVHLDSNPLSSLENIFVSNLQQTLCLVEAVKKMPYAVLFFENLHEQPKQNLEFLNNIFMGVNCDNQSVSFKNTIIIASTTLGSDKLSMLTTPPTIHETTQVVDLMQLVLNEKFHDSHDHQHLSGEDLCQAVRADLTINFSENILTHFNLVPFVSLEHSVFEKIIRNKLSILAKRLQSNFGIELSYAPEIVKFIAYEASMQRTNALTIDNLLDHYVYGSIAHEIMENLEEKNKPKHLFIKLNETGELVKCEFVNINETVT